MNFQDEIKSLSKISENFKKNKKPKSRWPAEFQLRVLKLIENGYSPKALSEKLNIPGQTYYHWRRVWKNAPKKNLNFIEVPVSDKLSDASVDKKEVVHIQTAKGTKLELEIEIFEKLILRGLFSLRVHFDYDKSSDGDKKRLITELKKVFKKLESC